MVISSKDDSTRPSNPLYGLHALNNLDIAVNGKGVNAMPSYAQVRQRALDSSGGSEDYSPPAHSKRYHVPIQPPRRVLEGHYATPVVNELQNHLQFKRRLLDSGGEGDFLSTTEETSSEQQQHRNTISRYDSPIRYGSRSPARTCVTDTELLRSPTQVMYAVSDRRPGSKAHSSSQTLQSELLRRRAESKENAFKTRILVGSSGGPPPSVSSNRSTPYKTTINTATDNIRNSYSDHYKTPRSKPLLYQTDSDSSYKYPQKFASTRLVKNATETYRNEMDREGRSIRRRSRRTYSGCSTSPDREHSSERYSKPRTPARSYSQGLNENRSPSSSPTRPPLRSRSSPNMVKKFPAARAHSTLSRKDYSGSRRVEETNDTAEARLARFTEYKGDDYLSTRPRETPRERGRSLPPGASIDSIGDFYKSSQFKSMYALPPSPNRPAPILDRRETLHYKEPRKNGIENIDRRQDSPKRRAPSPPKPSRINVRRASSGENGRRGTIDRTKRTGMFMRRRQSADGIGLDSSYSESESGPIEQRYIHWSSPSPMDEDDHLSERLSSRAVSVGRLSTFSTPVIRSSNTAIIRLRSDEKSPIIKRGSHVMFYEDANKTHKMYQDRPLGEFGRRWVAGNSDLDSDYRREMSSSGGLHQEARTRDGGARRSREERLENGTLRRNSRPTSRVSGHKKSPQEIEGDLNYSNNGIKMPLSRYDQNRVIRRQGSNVGVRREINRKKMPSSVTSSLNSSDSGERQVYRYNTTVADIPTMPIPALQQHISEPKRIENRENVPMTPASSQQKPGKVGRSISLLAPWKPRNYKDKFEIHYDNRPTYAEGRKPPRPPTQMSTLRRPTMNKEKRSASSSDLLKGEEVKVIGKPVQQQILPPQKKASSKVSRSVSMPKDTRIAGWFKKRKKT